MQTTASITIVLSFLYNNKQGILLIDLSDRQTYQSLLCWKELITGSLRINTLKSLKTLNMLQLKGHPLACYLLELYIPQLWFPWNRDPRLRPNNSVDNHSTLTLCLSHDLWSFTSSTLFFFISTTGSPRNTWIFRLSF